MRPILYNATETAFDSNGIGILRDAVSAPVYQELNGQYEMTLRYPVMGIHFKDIAMRTIIMAEPDPVTEAQPFRVYRITKPMAGVVTVYARHLVYDLMGVPVLPFSATGVQQALQALKSNALTDCPFTFFSDKSTGSTMAVAAPKPIWALLGGSAGSVLDVFGGEYEFDHYNVHLWNRRGADRGVVIRYGKNLTSLEQDENCANCYTGVYPYWVNTEGQRVELPEKVIDAPGSYSYVRILVLDLSQEWTETPTEEQLRARAERYIADNSIGIPDVSLKVEFVPLEQTEEYKDMALLERVLLGDTVTVFFPDMGVDATARVVAVDYDPILERYNSVTLGSVKANLADTIVQQQQQIQQAPTMTDLQKAQKAATSWLTNGKGYKVERRDAAGNTIDTLYMDTPDMNTAVNVLRVGQSGIGFSHSGVNGPYLSAWTIDGQFNADFITATSLAAALLRVGVIQSKDGRVKIDLTNGLIDATGNFRTSEEIVEGYTQMSEMSPEGVAVRDADGNYSKLGRGYSEVNDAGGYFAARAPDGRWQGAGGVEFYAFGVGSVAYGIMPYQEIIGDEINPDPKAYVDIYNDVDGTALNVLLQSGKVKISGLTAPENDSDAVNKAYVDNLFAQLKGS